WVHASWASGVRGEGGVWSVLGDIKATAKPCCHKDSRSVPANGLIDCSAIAAPPAKYSRRRSYGASATGELNREQSGDRLAGDSKVTTFGQACSMCKTRAAVK